jgi:transcriptional regulator with XRE-family HTH domain
MALSAPERLRKWRGEKPLREAAEDLGIDFSALNRFERGERTPTGWVAAKIEEVTKIPMALWF